jgi:hypothetical protein
MWTDAPMAEHTLRGEAETDRPGQDLPQVPRPEGGVRALSVYEPAAGYALVSYLVPSASSPDEALQATRERLRGAGFVEDGALSSAATETSSKVAQFQNQSSTVLVEAHAGRQVPSEVTYLWHEK